MNKPIVFAACLKEFAELKYLQEAASEIAFLSVTVGFNDPGSERSR